MRTQRFLIALAAFLFLFTVSVAADRGSYYRMIDDVDAGKNYYEILQVPMDANTTEIRKAYKKLALKYHPDKNPDPESYKLYLDIVFAFEVLSTPSTRLQYDEILQDGIPWHEQYYGKYAHQFGAPDHDIRYVLAAVIAIITVLKHAYLYTHYYNTLALVPSHPLYIKEVHKKIREIEKANPRPTHLAGKKLKEYQDNLRLEAEKQVGVEVVGLQKPTLRDIFLLDLVFLPLNTYKYFLAIYNDKRTPEQKAEDELRERMGCALMSDEDWKEEYAKHLSREEAYRASNRGKRDRRWMKKYVPVNDFDWD
eukprot:TRINITY_DN5006_c0_g2_i2.p1 TRINITY_DN5006_c0_g2~~TRINITY_DN5006_c0_g2_i2.p1  ORF type:complete len:309 (+),score=88.71 TRINITY_DN5006_c0_g2_i2:45-971(+)